MIAVRYGGTYERGRFAAFLCDPQEVPDDAIGDDVPCALWWERVRDGEFVEPAVAVGDTIDAAVENLARLVRERGIE